MNESRVAQLATLLAAMIVVLRTGHTPDLARHTGGAPEPTDSEVAALVEEATAELTHAKRGYLRRSLYFGLQSRVAKSLGVRPCMVSMVMSGKKTSKRVSTAIDKEVARIERQVRRQKQAAQ